MAKKELTKGEIKTAACKKLAHWISHTCKNAGEGLPSKIEDMIGDRVKLDSFLKGKGVSHAQLGEAIANTIKAVEGK